MQWKICIGISTEEAQVMSGKYNSLQALAKKESNYLDTLQSLSHGLNIVLEVVIDVVPYMKTRPLRFLKNSAFCTYMGA